MNNKVKAIVVVRMILILALLTSSCGDDVKETSKQTRRKESNVTYWEDVLTEETLTEQTITCW